MIAELGPYPAYKDSGVLWLGEVPEHWDVLPNRALFLEVRDRDCPNEEMLSVTITRGVIRQMDLLMDRSKKDGSNTDKSAYKLVQPGDIAYNKMRAWQGAVGVSEFRGIVSPAYVVQRPRGNAEPGYFHYLLRTPAFAKEAERWSYGITSDMWSLRPEHFKMIYSCRPPLSEQRAIVRFLTHADRRIRRYIRAKQKLIALLNEQKQAITHCAVTHGLDPDVRMKPSGVEWLGDVPEHWEVWRFKSIASVVGSLVDPRLPQHREKTLIAPNHIERGGTSRLLGSYSADAQGADSGKYEVRAGQIVYTKIRPYLRKAVIAPFDCLCSADMYPISVHRPDLISPEYLLLVMISAPFTQYTVDCSLRAAMPKVNREALGEAPVWFPKVSEQRLIIDYVHSATAKVSEVISEALEEIILLHELRTRLIADVVTGKLDVREAAARLPDEPEEPELLDGPADFGEPYEDGGGEDLVDVTEEFEP